MSPRAKIHFASWAIGQIWQISYMFLLEKNFGKPQMTHVVHLLVSREITFLVGADAHQFQVQKETSSDLQKR